MWSVVRGGVMGRVKLSTGFASCTKNSSYSEGTDLYNLTIGHALHDLRVSISLPSQSFSLLTT